MIRDKYLKILGLSGNPSEEEIKKAYRKLSREYHPDNHMGESFEKQKEYEEMMKKVNEAYDYLTRNKFDNTEYSKTADYEAADYSFFGGEKVNFNSSKRKNGTYYSYFHKKEIIDEDYEEEHNFWNDVWQDERFLKYHFAWRGNYKDTINYKKYDGEDNQILYYSRQSLDYKSVLTFKLFTLWQAHETNNDLKCKLNRIQIYGERKFLDRFFDSHPPLYFNPYFKKYVQIYFSAIDHFKELYSKDDLTLYKEISKYRRKVINKMINEYKEKVFQNGNCFEHEKVKEIIDKGIQTVSIYYDHDLMPSEVSSEIIDKVSEDWIGSYNHLPEDYEEWRNKMALFTSFWLQISMFYSNVIFEVFKFYKEFLTSNFKVLDGYALERMLTDIWHADKLSLTKEELKGIIEDSKIWNEKQDIIDYQEKEPIMDNKEETVISSNNSRIKKPKWWLFK